ncbi:MAG: UDP-glucose 6-dehydrogenase YwqF [Chlamydiia bacterium]|nr:UDP-glucose 6-dehydrogenase YwqF [Chlamydiia bacterium]
MKITVFGVGYVGLVTSACLAEEGHHTLAYDIDAAKIDRLKKSEIEIHEPGLRDLILQNQTKQHLHFTSTLSQALFDTFIIFIAVPTPSLPDGNANLEYIENVARTIGKHIYKPCVIVVKSTVPVGTTNYVHALIQQELDKRGEEVRFSTVSNPEFLREGSSVYDFQNPDRVIIGSNSTAASAIIKELYLPFVKSPDQICLFDTQSAELAKYAANAFLATKISFMNEISKLADRVGANIHMVKEGMAKDPRIGKEFLNAGVGYGGSCLPKDTKALAFQAQKSGFTPHLLSAVEVVNYEQQEELVGKIQSFCSTLPHRAKIAIWGLAFKPNTNDLRDAPSLAIIEKLKSWGAELVLFDPLVTLDNHTNASSPEESAAGADAIVLLTEWPLFAECDFARLAKEMRHQVIFDGRNLLSHEKLTLLGFKYFGMGTGERISPLLAPAPS